MPNPAAVPIALAYPDVYYAAPLVEHVLARRDIAMEAMAPPRLGEDSTIQHCVCRLLPPSLLLQQEGLRLLPGVGIATEERTGTERLVTNTPLERVGRIVVHPNATHLVPVLKIVYLEQGLPLPEFTDGDAEGADAFLCGGNEGRDRTEQAGHDLGALWRACTELPLVLGVWACSPGAPYRELRALLGKAAHGASFHQSDDRASEAPLHYTLLSREADSLRAFHALAVKHGLAEASGEAIVFC